MNTSQRDEARNKVERLLNEQAQAYQFSQYDTASALGQRAFEAARDLSSLNAYGEILLNSVATAPNKCGLADTVMAGLRESMQKNVSPVGVAPPAVTVVEPPPRRPFAMDVQTMWAMAAGAALAIGGFMAGAMWRGRKN
jgi:hypothetical protein